MILRYEDVDVFDAVVGWCVDVCLGAFSVEKHGVVHYAFFDGRGAEDVGDEGDGGGHDDHVGVHEPDPFGFGVEIEGFC